MPTETSAPLPHKRKLPWAFFFRTAAALLIAKWLKPKVPPERLLDDGKE